jgi:hypothetical protein
MHIATVPLLPSRRSERCTARTGHRGNSNGRVDRDTHCYVSDQDERRKSMNIERDESSSSSYAFAMHNPSYHCDSCSRFIKPVVI